MPYGVRERKVPEKVLLCIKNYFFLYKSVTATNVRCVIPPISSSHCSNLSGMAHNMPCP